MIDVPQEPIVAGIDVGSRKKGMHAVALAGGRYRHQFHSDDAAQIVEWCVKTMGASVIAVDAPCRWSADGHSRPAERQLMKKGIWCFSTPTRQRAVGHRTDNYGWMFNGEAVFRELERTHPLCFAAPPVGQKHCLETYPHAVTWHLRGGNADAREKRVQRRAVLATKGLDADHLSNIDWVDAALCALTAHLAATGEAMQPFGEPETGVILVPAIT